MGIGSFPGVAAALLLWWTCAAVPAAAAQAGIDEAGRAGGAVAGPCHEALVLRPGADCAYPGTDERFRAHAGGQAEFLAAAVSGSIDIDGEFDGRRFDLAATDLGDGSWRIDRVGGVAGTAVEAKGAPSGKGAPIELSGLQCSGRASVDGKGIEMRMEGRIHARSAVSSIVLTGRIEGELVDLGAIGRLGAGDSAGFALRGMAMVPHARAGEPECAVDVEYFDIGALRHGQPLRVKWQGRLAR